MPEVIVDAHVPGARAGEVFDRLRDFAAYPRHCSAVRQVTVTDRGGGVLDSDWSVDFRGGVLRWSERDHVDRAALGIDFVQTNGDFERFEGSWRVRAHDGAVTVRFTAAFDLGMPTLAAVLDPIAREALAESVGLILRGLLGDRITVTVPDGPEGEGVLPAPRVSA
ncbi:type II toxin-antitoxin system RatA family toxin [Streptomyces sp. NPDC007808]|uniref:type II toxin-antitoxin system RatA family toxin n=1 Tax=Streptomyces sp. NPDC007808 TaxID=3364779 RepID=UPI0036B2F4BC